MHESESTAVLSSPNAIVRDNPYVGPRSIVAGEKIYGRERETLELFDLLIAQRIVLLHSPSGAGKSSLLNAALLPRLVEEGFEVLPVMRVNRKTQETKTSVTPSNRYALSILTCLEEALPKAARKSEDELATLTVTDYLADYSARRTLAVKSEKEIAEASPPQTEEPRYEVFIFDQFEEILTRRFDRSGC